MSLFSKKIPVIYTLVIGVICSIVSFILLRVFVTTPLSASEVPATTVNSNCNYAVARLKGYKYIRPLVDEAPECEAQSLASLKQDIANIITRQQQQGIITAASVYLKSLSDDNWTYVNPQEKFAPGSLFKVPVMMCVLKMAETNPSFLNSKLLYDPKVIRPMKQTFITDTIKAGKSYTVKELLAAMVANSDNAAAMLLTTHIDYTVFNKMFADLGVPPPDITSTEAFLAYSLTAREYSTFLATLYNGSYLTSAASEYATSLLAQCNFKDGLVKELPPDVKIAHKFGEAVIDGQHQLHESGIIYFNNTAYIITVMTKGKDIKQQADVISNLSHIVYAKMLSAAS